MFMVVRYIYLIDSLHFLILGVLRVLGRGTCFDGIEELTHGSAEAHRMFFHRFIEKFCKTKYNEYIYPPRNDEELNQWTADYRRMGLPGMLGSTYCDNVNDNIIFF